MIRVDLTEEEAESFKVWREHQNRFMVLVKAKAFEIRPGVVSFNINKDGVITRVFASDVEMYRRKAEK